jgi:Flp pilus assembly protein TadB
VALFRRNADPAPAPEPNPATPASTGAKKDRPTPSRKEAEAARRERVHKTLSNRESRQVASRQARAERMRRLGDRERSPEKALMRDYIDARLNLGEFLLPAVVVILAITVLGSYFPQLAVITTLAMYLFILAVIVDGFLMWRGFKRVLAERLPNAPIKGLVMYGMTRSTQIRRFRMPPPRIKRGEAY